MSDNTDSTGRREVAEDGKGGGPRGSRGADVPGRRARPASPPRGASRGSGEQRRTPRGAGPHHDNRGQPRRSFGSETRAPRSSDESSQRYDDPPLPADVEPKQLAPEVRRELSTLNRVTADAVACHLVAAGMLLDEDPHAALRHAKAARARSTRITAVREAVGIAAYHCGDWSLALGELRAARRMGSKSVLLPVIADCERGLGRPQRAIELAAEATDLEGDDADELRIVVAGARSDLGQLEQALTVLSSAPNDLERTGSTAARLHYAHGETLVALGRNAEALEWFLRAAAADVDGVTDVEDRISELAGAATLADEYDCLLVDLDGTVFCGGQPTAGAVQTLHEIPARVHFVTNNSSRSAAQVAAHLTALGFTAEPADVVTSAQVAAHLLAERLPASSPVLVVGTEALSAEISDVGLVPVRLASDNPAAVVQGLSTELTWSDLAEAALAIRAGALWMATNIDTTLPSERGLLPGNGSLVAALRAATGAEPDVAGKPSPALLGDALSRGEFYAPLVVGDRLDTDIAAANAAGLPSLMVLTGASSARDAVGAIAEQRPTYLGHDLRALHLDADTVAIGPQPYWQISTERTAQATTLTVAAALAEDDADDNVDGLSIVRALAAAVAEAELGGQPFTVESADDVANAALQRWSLLGTWA